MALDDGLFKTFGMTDTSTLTDLKIRASDNMKERDTAHNCDNYQLSEHMDGRSTL